MREKSIYEVQFDIRQLKESKPKPWKGSYVCPKEPREVRRIPVQGKDANGNPRVNFVDVHDDPYVDKDYCDSFNEGGGCKYRDTCPAYELHNGKPKNGVKHVFEEQIDALFEQKDTTA